MTTPSIEDNSQRDCNLCRDGKELTFDFSMAFQPLVDLDKGKTYGYEALVRGLQGEPAPSVIGQVTQDNMYRFDQTCRVKAVALASRLGLKGLLSINFMPNAVYRPEVCIRTTLAAAERYDFPISRINFEIVEVEKLKDPAHLKRIVLHYKDLGFQTALDDFGAAYAGLNLLAQFQPDVIKIDMFLVRDIHRDHARRAIVKHTAALARDLGVSVLAEGIETRDEMHCLLELGIFRQQGFLFAKPAFEALPEVDFDSL